jgi:hypothetical protein
MVSHGRKGPRLLIIPPKVAAIGLGSPLLLAYAAQNNPVVILPKKSTAESMRNSFQAK